MVSWYSKILQRGPVLLLALAFTSAWAVPGRSAYHPPPISRYQSIDHPPIGKPLSTSQVGKPVPGVDTIDPTENPSVVALRGSIGLDGRSRAGYYSAGLATSLYLSGLVSLSEAEAFGYNRSLEYAWERFRQLRGSREPTTDEWRGLLEAEVTRAEQKRESVAAEKKRALDERVRQYQSREAPLTSEVIAALQSARIGRTAVLDPEIPDVVVKLADDPALDRTIIDHTWFRHASALTAEAARKALHVVNLFPDPIGDSLLREIDQYIGDGGAGSTSAVGALRDMLMGKREFDLEKLTLALSAAPGQTIYIVSHIPDSAPGTGRVEFNLDGNVTAIPISQLQVAFSKANVNLFIVGCSSAQHTATGLSKEINNVDALTGFLRALQAGNDRTLFGWHAAIAADAKVVVDPVATEVYGVEAASDALSKVTLERDGRTVSTGYVGTFAPPPVPAGTALPPSTALSVALGALAVPSDRGECRRNPSLAQTEVAARLVPLATIILILILCLEWIFLLLEEARKVTDSDYFSAFCVPIIFGLPIIFARYSWGDCLFGCNFEPGLFLVIWCLLYAAMFGFVWGINKKRGFNLLLILAILFAGACVLFGASYLGLGADQNIQRFCDAVLKL